MFTLIKNADLFSPKSLGKKDVLFTQNKILKIDDQIDVTDLQKMFTVKIIDANNNYVVPGFIDPHIHLLGGGGEGGFHKRTPEVQLSDLIKSGLTTVVGLLGTDGTTRHVSSLLAKARGLEKEGVTTFIYTGNYDVPTPTITGNVKDDIILIDKIIGTAEIAIADSRSGQPSTHELAKIIGDSRVGGLIGGKVGVTHFHTGPGKAYLSQLHEVLDEYELPASKLYATHINRSKELMNDAITLGKKGAFIDITCDYDEAFGWVKYYKENNGDLSQLTLSTDGNGSLPKFDDDGNLLGLDVAPTDTILETVKRVVQHHILSLEEVLCLVTTNTSRALELEHKGKITKDYDADILIIDRDTFKLTEVFMKGRQMMSRGAVIVKGTFE
uniref:beta-aspartyl-peptidase n=1 Tax=Nosocomiicoccus ampullae TaxID=489910 RepID=UPI00082EAD99|nr:beta-aspartyl-peptidase [Nosocomiicoccus ampullae]